jgi:hypothetical protein
MKDKYKSIKEFEKRLKSKIIANDLYMIILKSKDKDLCVLYNYKCHIGKKEKYYTFTAMTKADNIENVSKHFNYFKKHLCFSYLLN